MNKNRWQMQEAKNRFSELVRRARDDGPQIISVHGQDAVVVMKVDEYQHLCGQGAASLVEFFELCRGEEPSNSREYIGGF
jgi:prevent-host-death family protein